jgi:hypothetical protein
VVGHHFRAGLLVVRVRVTGALAGAAFNHDAVTTPDELIGGRGQQRDAMFLAFDFLGDTDDHSDLRPVSLPHHTTGPTRPATVFIARAAREIFDAIIVSIHERVSPATRT